MESAWVRDFARVGDVQNQRVRKSRTKCFPCCNLFILYILLPQGARSFLSSSVVNKYWNSFRRSVATEKAFGLIHLTFRGSVPVLVFVYLSEYSE